MKQTRPSPQAYEGRGVGPVCLIIPPSGFLLEDGVFPPLGILRVARVLERLDVKVDVLDLSRIKNFPEVIAQYARTHSDVMHFGLTATTPQMPAVSQIVSALRDVRRDARIILGGPHVTLVNAAHRKEVKRNIRGRAVTAMCQIEKLSDVAVAGDGEKAIFAALEQGAQKLINADDIHSELYLKKSDLDELLPARHLIDILAYSKRYKIDGVNATSLIGQLGCPYGCTFCGGRFSPTFRKMRSRSPESIVAEMVSIYQTYKIFGFMFYDDELNIDNDDLLERMRLITEAQKKLGVQWCLRGFVKSERFTAMQARAMYSAGFRWILTGFESGSEEILKVIKKGATREQNTECVRIAHSEGLKVKALMSIGHPGETRGTIEETRRWLLQVLRSADDFDATIIEPYMGTPNHDEANPHPSLPGVWVYTDPDTGAMQSQLAVDHTQVANNYKGIPGEYVSHIFTNELTPGDIVSLRDSLEQDVREKLGIPYNKISSGGQHEHSMGNSGKYLLDV